MKKIFFASALALLMLSLGTMAAYANDNALRVSCVEAIIDHSSINYTKQSESVLERFTDVSFAEPSSDDLLELSRYDSLKKMVAAAVEKGIINGYEDGTLRLNENVTRAEFACMIYRARDFMNPRTALVPYDGAYTDLNDWNRDAIIYCMQNGFLIGYGDKFGSNDFITTSQLEIVTRRMSYGLTKFEKYALMDLCGINPLPISVKDISNSVNEEEIASCTFTLPTYCVGGSKGSEKAAYKLIRLLDILSNQDCDALRESTRSMEYNFTYNGPPRNGVPSVYPHSIELKYGDEEYYISTNIYEIIDNITANNIKREGINTIAVQNVVSYGIPSIGYTRGCGYEYYTYTQGDNLPEGIELGVWYRRKFVINYEEDGRAGRADYIYIDFSEPQMVAGQ